MSIRKYLDTAPLFEIAKYDKHPEYQQDCISFVGAPRKHPYDKQKMLLIHDPFSSKTVFYEFLIKDILAVDDLPSIATEDGESAKTVRIWVLKGSLGLKYEPFEVAEPLNFLSDSEVLKQYSAE
jgi:inorganic pyrophosphatase